MARKEESHKKQQYGKCCAHPSALSRPCRKDPETFPYFKYSKTPPSTIFGINIDL